MIVTVKGIQSLLLTSDFSSLLLSDSHLFPHFKNFFQRISISPILKENSINPDTYNNKNSMGLRISRMKRIEEEWTVLWCESVDDFVEAIHDKEFIWPLIWRGVRWLIDEKRTSAMILECRLIDGRETVWISVSEEDVESTLDKLIQYRLEREEYEECAAIRDLLHDWITRDPASSQLEGDQINSGANEDK